MIPSARELPVREDRTIARFILDKCAGRKINFVLLEFYPPVYIYTCAYTVVGANITI